MRTVTEHYEILRKDFGIMDSIRFTADHFKMKAIDVAEELGLTNYFILNH
jgi:hypothetical protein